MDVNSLINNKKRKKHCKGEEDESSVKIFDLPDPILQLIISSLPTKDAIRTSVLCKSWLHLWKGMSKIELAEQRPEKRQQFIDFVRKLLADFNCSSLRNFSLSCKVDMDASLVNEWLHGFINPKIQELSLDLERIQEPLQFPDHLFTCTTLAEFQLSMRHIFKLPSPIHFESLRTLTLKYIIFPNSSSTHQLFSGCPSLEELTLIDCDWSNVKAISISSPSLQKVVIREWLAFDFDDDDDDDSEDDDIGGQNVSNCCEVEITGTSLRLFSYDGVLMNDYFLYDSTSVTNASIQIPPLHGCSIWGRDPSYYVFELLSGLSSVESLSISDTALLAITDEESLIANLPLFSNLAELRVVSLLHEELAYQPLLVILQNSPCLQVINFEGGVYLPKDFAKYKSDQFPICFRTHLKMVRIDGFFGHDKEIDAIKYLLQASSVLDKLYVCFSLLYPDCRLGSKKLEKSEKIKRLKKIKNLCKQITRFPRGSMNCEIDFKYYENKR